MANLTDIEGIWSKFQISGHEEEVVDFDVETVDSGLSTIEHSLVMKLQTTKPYNMEAFKATLKQLWRCNGGPTIADVGENLLIAIFPSRLELQKIMARSPWSFDKC